MKALRLVLHQNSANYRKEETIDNKMTYPLPPPSTVIGAIHNACGFSRYQPMDVSIQGRYESMHKAPYTDYCFLNTVQDDRGVLVKMANGALLSNGFVKVASAKKPQGNSFRNNITIQVHDRNLLEVYQRLKDHNDEILAFKKERIDPLLKRIKQRKKHLAEKKKSAGNTPKIKEAITSREKELKALEKRVKNELKEYQETNYTKPISCYRSLTTSLKYYEILTDIELVIHIKTKEDEVLDTIYENAWNIKSIGRSEDFIDLQDAKIVDLTETDNCTVYSDYSAYVGYEEVRQEKIYTKAKKGRDVNGTKYYLNKNYELINGKRMFNKVKVLYTSKHAIEETSASVFLDREDEAEYIVNFL